MEIIDKISLRPAVIEKDQDEIYLCLSNLNEIILHDCNGDECLLSPTMQSVPLWVNTRTHDGPKASLTAWMYDEHTPESCLIAGLSQDSIDRVFNNIDRGILIIKHLTDILILRQGSRLVLDSDVAYINTTRVRVITSVWKDMKKTLTYDAALAKERVDKYRKSRIERIDKEINYLSEELSKRYIERLELIRGGGKDACKNEE